MVSTITAEVDDLLITPSEILFSNEVIFRNNGKIVEPTDLGTFHIYMICRRNRISVSSILAPNNILSHGRVRGVLNENAFEGSFIKHRFEIDISNQIREFSITDPQIRVLCEKDRRGIFIENSDSRLSIPIAGSSSQYIVGASGIFNLEVLYIGQSQAKNKNYDLIRRLKSHEQLNRAQSETSGKFPNKEIVLMFLKIRQSAGGAIHIDGKKNFSSDKLAKVRLAFQAANRFPQLVNLFEMAAINYFKPEFNTRFKDKIPESDPTIQFLKSNSIDQFGMRIDSEYFQSSLFSENRKQQPGHSILLSLNDLMTFSFSQKGLSA